MYENTKKKITFLLDQMLSSLVSSDELIQFIDSGREIKFLLKAKKDLLTIDMQEKILKILSIRHSYDLIKLIQSENYQHLGSDLVKLLDLSEPFSSDDVIETLYKMGDYQYTEEIRPFTTLSIDDKMPFREVSYRVGHSHFIKFGSSENSSFKFLNDSANKYIKMANIQKAKQEGNDVYKSL